MNSTGGIAGRKVVPVIYELDPARSDPLAVQYQEACARFFEDNRVTALVSLFLDPVLAACAAKAAAPFVAGAVSTWNTTRLNQFPTMAIANHPVVEAATRTLATELVQQGWFRPAGATEKVAIGLITHEEPAFKDVKPIVEATLERAGLTLADTAYMPFPRESADIGRASAAGRSAALRFSSKGINRVIAIDQNGFALVWFTTGAASQSYYPRLGLSSLSQPATEPEVLTPESLAGAAGVGWAPYLDVPAGKQAPTSRRTTECLDAMKKAGENTSTAASRLGALGICDAGSLLATAWRGGDFAAQGFTRGLAALGTSYGSAVTFGTDFTNSRAGASRYRPLAYNSSCDCFEYTGSAKPLR